MVNKLRLYDNGNLDNYKEKNGNEGTVFGKFFCSNGEFEDRIESKFIRRRWI